MKYLKFKKTQLGIHPLFIVLIVIMIALGYIEQFFILIFIITIHEFTHVLVGFKYGLSLKKFVILPVGELAMLNKLEDLKSYQRYIILLSGPLINIFLGTITYLLLPVEKEIFHFFMIANFSIGVFNFLPIYPLDGGRILYFFMCQHMGTLISNQKMRQISKIFSLILILIGMIQLIMYPFNASLLAVGIYLYSVNKKQFIYLTYEFYKELMEKERRLKLHQLMPLKTIIVNQDTPVIAVLKKLQMDSYHMIYIMDHTMRIETRITETQIIDYVMKYGTKGSMEDYLNQI